MCRRRRSIRLLKARPDCQPGLYRDQGRRGVQGQDTAPNQLWQTDFTYLKVIGWGWFYLSSVLDDFSRYIVAWKLCTTMKAEDVTATLDLALQAAGLRQAELTQRPRLLSDNGSSYIAAELAKWLDGQNTTVSLSWRRPVPCATSAGSFQRAPRNFWHEAMAGGNEAADAGDGGV